MSALKQQIQEDMKTAMREKQKDRLAAIRLIIAAIKQWEIDNRETADDTQCLVILDKLGKQRRDSIEAYTKANRQDLVDKEQSELQIIQNYLPQPLSEAEIDQLIQTTIASVGADSMQDMGKVMGQLKPKIQGRVDMAQVSKKIKSLLA